MQKQTGWSVFLEKTACCVVELKVAVQKQSHPKRLIYPKTQNVWKNKSVPHSLAQMEKTNYSITSIDEEPQSTYTAMFWNCWNLLSLY